MEQNSKAFADLYPLVETTETEKLESELKAIFINVFSEMLLPYQQDLLHYGLPHLARDSLLKKISLYDGLSIMRADYEIERLRFLLKAWKIKNQKRGFYFLKTYLQMLYPNAFTINQLWQETAKPYPDALVTETEMKAKGTPHWLTSRVMVQIVDLAEDGSQLLQFIPTIRSVLAARFLLQLSVLKEIGTSEPNTLVLANGMSMFQRVSFSGNAILK